MNKQLFRDKYHFIIQQHSIDNDLPFDCSLEDLFAIYKNYSSDREFDTYVQDYLSQ